MDRQHLSATSSQLPLSTTEPTSLIVSAASSHFKVRIFFLIYFVCYLLLHYYLLHN